MEHEKVVGGAGAQVQKPLRQWVSPLDVFQERESPKGRRSLVITFCAGQKTTD